MKKSAGRKQRRQLARSNRRAEGKEKMKRHNYLQKLLNKKVN